MASIINAGTTTATAINFVTDTTGALVIQTSGANAISISSSQAVTLANPLPAGSGGTGVTSLGTGVATALGQNVTGSGSIVLAASPTLTGTPIAPTAAVGTNTPQIATTAFVRSIIPTGVILLWSGSVASIPSGWVMCDGTNSTPDLRDRFIVGAGSTYAVAATGGSTDAIVVSHTHTATSTDSGHVHAPPTGLNTPYLTNPFSGDGSIDSSGVTGPQERNATTGNSASAVANITTTVASAGSSGTNANLPPYYALAYIMKA